MTHLDKRKQSHYSLSLWLVIWFELFPSPSFKKRKRLCAWTNSFFKESAFWLLKHSWLRSGKWRAKKHFKLGSWINYGKSTGGIKVGLVHTKYKKYQNTKFYKWKYTYANDTNWINFSTSHAVRPYTAVLDTEGWSRVHQVSTQMYGTAAIRNFQMFNTKTFAHLCILSRSQTCKKGTK